MKIISKSEEDTIKIAEQFALQLKGGEVILLYGDLGAGKTVFVKGLAKALGVREVVKSSTFNLMKVYKIPKNKNYSLLTTHYSLLCHIDAYRLKNFGDLLDIGAEEYLGKENVISVVEWADRIDEKVKKQKNKEIKESPSSIPPLSKGGDGGGRIIKIKIEHGKKDNERIITIN